MFLHEHLAPATGSILCETVGSAAVLATECKQAGAGGEQDARKAGWELTAQTRTLAELILSTITDYSTGIDERGE